MWNWKRLTVLILFLAVVAALGWLLFVFFFQSPPPGNTNLNTNGSSQFPPISNGNISRVNGNTGNTNLPVFPGQPTGVPTDIARGGLTNVIDNGEVRDTLAFVSGAAGASYYDKVAGQFYRFDGAKTLLSDKKFFNVQSVAWSRDQKKAVLEYPDGSNIVYDFVNDKQVTLPAELYDFSFDLSGNNIAGKWQGKDNDENWLMVGSADSSNFRLIEPMGDNAASVQVGYSPNNQVVALYPKARDAKTQIVLPIGLHGENFKSFVVDGLNFSSSWSSTGNSLLYSTASLDNNYNPKLWLTSGTVDTLGGSSLDLQLNTWPDKCAFNNSGSSLYCAEPVSLPRGAGLYPEVAKGVPDVFYRIDLNTGTKVPLAIPVGSQSSYSADSVWLSSDESLLYFIDSTTSRLQSIRLK